MEPVFSKNQQHISGFKNGGAIRREISIISDNQRDDALRREPN
jgi:hypothetical protein